MRRLTIGKAEGRLGNSEIKNIDKLQKFVNKFGAIIGNLNIDKLNKSAVMKHRHEYQELVII
jgi:hypothetical protein